MISNIFGKTKPINFIIVFAFVTLLYGLTHLFINKQQFDTETIIFHLFTLIILLFSVFVADFIMKRNKVTAPNTFGILFYGLLIMLFVETISDNKAIFCSLFILLTIRRLISLRSLKEIKLKIFDATFWVIISSLFYEWMALYLLLVFAAIYIYEPKNIRNWLVPFASIFVVFVITYSILLLLGKTDYLATHYQFSADLNSIYFLNWESSSKLLIYVLLTLLVSIFAFLKLGKAGVGQIVTMRLIGFAFVIGLVVKIMTPSTDAFLIIITFFPAVIFFTNYVEAIKKPNIKEIVLMFSILGPFLVFITQLALK